MAEVHEITRTAFDQMLDSGRIIDTWSDYGEWIVVVIERGINEWILAVEGNFGNVRQANKRADVCNENNLYVLSKGWSMYPAEYEVWHLVEAGRC